MSILPLIFVYDITDSNFELILPIYYGTINTIDWDDGNITTGSGNYNTDRKHTYENSRIYTVTITGSNINNISYSNEIIAGLDAPTGQNYLIECTSFGEIGLIDLTNAFNSAINLATVPTSLPINSNIQIMDSTFTGCSSLNQDISGWNVSTVTSMSNMFSGTNIFNQNLSSWNVSNVTNMSYMFYGAVAFNNGNNALNWSNKTSQVVDMSYMFYGTTSFNQDISSWNVSNVEYMQYMFCNASAFNQDISSWNIIKVKDMNNMFNYAISFNNGGNSLNWGSKTNKVINMSNMFFTANSFNQDISGWDVTNVTDMSYMFCNNNVSEPYAYNNGGNALSWGSKTYNVKYMYYMFSNAKLFNQDINSWDVTNVTDMSYMFNGAISFNKNINTWGNKISKVTNMSNMFNYAIEFNQDVNNWDVTNVIDMSYMFAGAALFNKNINSWGNKTSKVENMSNMFSDATSFNQNISGLNISSVTDMSNMFYGATSFNQNMSNFNISNITNIYGIYGIFDYSGLSITNYNNILNGWAALPVKTGLYFEGNGLVYSSSGLSGHNTLATKWIFSGDAYISINPIYTNTSFTFIINAGDSDTFYQASDFTLSSNNLSPTISTKSFDGTTPTTLVYSNLIFTTNGNKIPVVLNGIDGDVNITYYLDVNSEPTCFNENTKILTDKGYVNIQDIRKGDLVKTLKHGYVSVNMIGQTKFYNSRNNLRGKNKLYKCTPDKYPELTEVLIITGCHSILVDKFKNDEEKKLTIEILGKIYVTDGKYRLPACVDNNAIPYEEEGLFNIYHIALDNDNYYSNYGIYANGLLVETCSKRYLKELSGMDLIK